MSYLNFGVVRTFTKIVDSRGTKASVVGVVICTDTINHNYIVIDTNGDEWTFGIGRVEVSPAKIDAQTQSAFNSIIKHYNNIYDLNMRASEIEADIVYHKSEVQRVKEQLHKLNFKK